jgi:hypothetical protein
VILAKFRNAGNILQLQKFFCQIIGRNLRYKGDNAIKNARQIFKKCNLGVDKLL